MEIYRKVLFTFVFMIVHLFGQIEIDWTEVPQDIGIAFTHNGAESVTVNLGSPGGPHSWDFTNQPMGSQNTNSLIVPRASTPFGDSFPNSNLVLEITEGSIITYAYGQIAPTFGANLGMGSTVPITTFFRFEPTDSYPMPVFYGASRNYYYAFSLEPGPGLEVQTDNYGNETIDAYGSVTVPYGTFECLRARSFDTTVVTMYVAGIPVSTDTTSHIRYEYLAEEYGLIVHVLSYPDEIDTNFTDADFLERITSFSTGIVEHKDELMTCYYLTLSPNPTTGTIQLRYSIHDAGSTDQELRKPFLEIYDATGRVVKSFYPESNIMDQESAISWHGDDNTGKKLPSGVYFVRLEAGETTVTRKLTLIR
jgi:hypothetical protein